jgi:hypothetical protein
LRMVGTIRLYPAAWVIQAGDVVCRAERLLQMFVLMPSFREQFFWRWTEPFRPDS